MPDFKAQVFVCATVDAEVDGRHCGSKGGSEIRAKFNRQIVEHGLIARRRSTASVAPASTASARKRNEAAL